MKTNPSYRFSRRSSKPVSSIGPLVCAVGKLVAKLRSTLVGLFVVVNLISADDAEIARSEEAGSSPKPGGFVRLEPRTFKQGSATTEVGRGRDEALHEVQISRPFLMGVTEVTNGEMMEMLRYGFEKKLVSFAPQGVTFPVVLREPETVLLRFIYSDIAFVKGEIQLDPSKAQFPCTGMSWYGALFYANLRSLHDGLEPAIEIEDWTCDFNASGYRLPTESEWELACRAGGSGPYGSMQSNGSPTGGSLIDWQDTTIDQFAWFRGSRTSSGGSRQLGVARVGAKRPNLWGLYDMHGNVSEWCWDWYGPYPKSAVTDPLGSEKGWMRVVRGGSFNRMPARIRSAVRETGLPFDQQRSRGFRLVRSLVPSE